MAPIHSKVLTDLLLAERFEKTKNPPWSLRSKVYKLLHDERSHLSPHVWVFWGLPYQKMFDGIGHNLRFRRTMGSNTGTDRPMRVYDGSKYSLRDFLDLEESLCPQCAPSFDPRILRKRVVLQGVCITLENKVSKEANCIPERGRVLPLVRGYRACQSIRWNCGCGELAHCFQNRRL